jgi:hypothetical protein
MILTPCSLADRLQLSDMASGTPAIRTKWWSTLWRAILLTINGVPVSTVLDVEQKVQRARQTGLLKATCEFATVGSHSAHPIEGLLQLHYDQINVIAVHLKDFSLHSTTPVVQTDQADNVDTSCPMCSPSSVPSSIPHSQPSITTTGYKNSDTKC